MKLSDILVEGSDTHPRGCMVGFWVPPLQAQELVQPDGEPPDELHLTLAYLGKGLSRGLVNRLAGVCASYAASRAPMSGVVEASDTFPASESSDGKDVLVAKPDIAGIMEFREGLVRRLENAGGKVSRNFDFTPHITLAYVEPGTAPLVEVRRVPLRFRELVLAVGDDRRHFPLGLGR